MPDRSWPRRVFWSAALGVIALDLTTKRLAVRGLHPYVPRAVIGETVRLTLAYNAGAAFSMTLGSYQRSIFSVCAVIALVLLWRMYRDSAPHERWRVLAVGLAWGGAAGNLIDRLFRGAVVDFIDVGYHTHRFWTFNVADSAVTVGAILLALVLWREDGHAGKAVEEGRAGPPSA